MKSKILIVEDVPEMSALISLYLSKEGMETVQCETAEDALKQYEAVQPDLLILDLNLPGMDGFEFLSYLRKKSNIPVIIVSARDADEDIITGLGYGADEFVTKPFSPRVLTARVRALMRRVKESPESDSSANSVVFGPFRLDYNSCTLVRMENGKKIRIPLSAKEYGVLEYLVKNAGKPLSPDVIYRDVWGRQYGDFTAVAVYIQRLRKKIEEDCASPRYIETIFGMGYKFNIPQ